MCSSLTMISKASDAKLLQFNLVFVLNVRPCVKKIGAKASAEIISIKLTSFVIIRSYN